MDVILNRTSKLKLLFSICIPIIFIFSIYKIIGIFFETNDDKLITEILSGTLTGQPEAHTVYLNYLLSYPLCLLYRISIHIPWYGGMLVLCHIAVYIAVLQSAFSQSDTVTEFIFSGGAVCCCILLNLYITSAIQYTSAAALMAIAGYVCILLHKDSKKGFLLFFCFELMAFLVRSHAMLMIQPLGAAVYIGFCIDLKKNEAKICLQKMMVLLFSIGSILVIGLVGNQIGYSGKDWDDYKRYNAARTELFDYYDPSTYEEVKFILDKYHVTQTEYEAFCNYIILDWDISVECIEELALYAKKTSDKSFDLKALLKEIWGWPTFETYMGTDQISKVVWSITLLWIFVRKKWHLLFPLGGLAVAKTIIWGYLLFRGRLPLRVSLPLISCEIFLLLASILRSYAGEKQKRRMFPILLCIAFFLYCIPSYIAQYRESVNSNKWQDAYIYGLIDIQNYCESHPENRYLLDSWSFIYYRGSVFMSQIYGRKNYASTGNWFSNSPVSLQYLQNYLYNNENLYLIVYDADGKPDYASAFLADKFGVTPELTERLTVSHGGSYLVWYFGN